MSAASSIDALGIRLIEVAKTTRVLAESAS